MWRRRKRVRACSSSAVRSVPSTTTAPAVGRSMPAITLSSVDLPEPLRPTSTTLSPRAIVTDTSRSTTRSASPSRYDLLTFRSSRAGGGMPAHSTLVGALRPRLTRVETGGDVLARRTWVESGALGHVRIRAQTAVEQGAVASQDLRGRQLARAQLVDERGFLVVGRVGKVRDVAPGEQHAAHRLLELAHVARPGIAAGHAAFQRFEHPRRQRDRLAPGDARNEQAHELPHFVR